MKKMNVAIIGCQFMGKAHSSGWGRTSRFFDTAIEPVLKVACDIRPEQVREFAARWGWESTETDWRAVVERKDVDIVDICVPTFLHHEIAIAAAQAGKHIFCEKPIAVNCEAARKMLQAARQAGIVHYVNHNYRRCPAVALARQFIDEGKLGRIFHWRGAYLQSWIIDPAFPLTWHLKKETAGAGPHFDLNSHSVDLARFLVGEISSVTAMISQFIQERPLEVGEQGGTFGAISTGVAKGKVTVEDAAFMLTEFENGALGSFESSRFATGRKNYNYFEIYGSQASLAFNLERMNELQFYSAEDAPQAQGFRTILATESIHPYVGHWWPPGHIIGYEHTFVHAMADFLNAIAAGGAVRPNFEDGVKTMEILEAALMSAASGFRMTIGK
jgi:predicted dehydrogenase